MKRIYTSLQCGNIASIISMIAGIVAAIIAVFFFNVSMTVLVVIYVIGQPVLSILLLILIKSRQRHLYESSRRKYGLPYLDYEDMISNQASRDGYDYMLNKVKEAGMHSDSQIEDWYKENPWK